MEGFRKMKGKIYESSNFDKKSKKLLTVKSALTNDSKISLNWNTFKIHISKCEKCQSKCLVIWSHIVKEDFEK